MVVKEAVGAPLAAVPVPVAPTAFGNVPLVVSTPVKLYTVIEQTTACEMVAVAVTFVSVEGANAAQISESPLWVFVRLTNAQVKPPPDTPETVVFAPPR